MALDEAQLGDAAPLALLAEAADKLLGTLDLETLLPQVLELAERVLSADAHALWRYDAGADVWSVQSVAGLSREYQDTAMDAIRGSDVRLPAAGPFVVEDVETTNAIGLAHREAHLREGNRAFVAMPLVHREALLGTLVFYYREPRAFAEAELVAAGALADVSAAAIGTADLYRRERETADRAQFLADASALLASSLDDVTTLGGIARLAVPRVADWCIVDVLDPETGTLREVAVAGDSPEVEATLRQMRREYPPIADGPQPAARVLRTGETIVFPPFTPETLRETVRDARHLELVTSLRPFAAIAVPLIARGETLGAITFTSTTPARTYGPAEIGLAEELARHAALAVDNARVYVAEHQARERLAVLAEASTTLASSLDYETTLANVARLIVPDLADWCAVDLVAEDTGRIDRIAVVHRDPELLDWAERSRLLYAPDPDEPEGTSRVLRTGEPLLYREITDDLLRTSTRDEGHLEVLRRLGMRSAMVVPLMTRGRRIGALMFVSSRERAYDDDDLDFAQHIGRRTAVAVDNARLYRELERRAQAAQALAFVGDGVFLVDHEDVVRLWNPAAAQLVQVSEEDVLGRNIRDVFPGWPTFAEHVPVAHATETRTPRPETLPVEVGGRELWLSISGVAFEGGTVYAFRDLTEERAVEKLKSDFVATVSHELRTPLAAIYGAALTLRRPDMLLDEPQRSGLLDVIAGESDRLARIVNDILWASRLDSDTMQLAIESCDACALATTVVDAARAYLPPNLSIALTADVDVARVAADAEKVRQVLTNLVENAVKYSPDGGRIEVAVEQRPRRVRFVVADQGLGVPPAEQRRIFEKFYRLDPNLTRGVGGTGLGLYICRELVRRMDGSIWVESNGRDGSTFVVELPQAS